MLGGFNLVELTPGGWALNQDKHRGPTTLGVDFFKLRPTGVYFTKLKPPRNILFLKSRTL